MKHVLVIIIVFLGLSSSVSASHFRAGEITYVQLSERTFEVTVTTYTLFDVGLPDDVGSNAADNPFVMVTWGDNSPVEDVNRTVLEQVSPTIRRNEYTATHTYPVGAGASYRISIAEANRIDGIVNINEGNSLFQMFYLETVINIQDPVFLGLNSSPILLQPPLDNGFIDARFIHNPNAFDPDGDSLAYELIVPQVDIGQEVERYRSPDLVNPGPNNVVTFDELTGDFIWDTPQQVGIYNIAILVREFRNGALISEIVRDIQFTIENGDINPPTVETINDTCIVAGTLLEFEVFGDDEDAGQRVLLSATGGPLQFSPAEGPATFTAPAVFQDPIVTGNFSWQTECQHIRRNPYQIVFRAVDDFDGEGLATLERLNITVAPPPPVIIDVVPDGLTNVITWESPYPCEDDDSFVGFRVYRRIGPSEIELDTCNPSLPGYELIEQNTTEVLNGDFIFRDENIEPGIIYCYRVVATYAENFFNAIPFESLASEQICIIAEQDIPFITQVDVAETSMIMGEIDVKWTNPRLPDYDTTVFVGPYTIDLIRIDNGVESTVFSESFASFQGVIDNADTTFTDTGLNTVDEDFSYRVAFSASVGDPAISPEASSIFLTTSSSTESVTLSYSSSVPWTNEIYRIFRSDSIDGVFVLIDSTTSLTFTDSGLEDGVEQCYFVEASGVFGVETLPDSTINRSQIACDTPVDETPPCSPVIGEGGEITFSSICDPNNDVLRHTINWLGNASQCSDDVSGYRIYFSMTNDFAQAELVEDGSNQLTGTFVDDAISERAFLGCYFVSAVDAAGNESTPVLAFCGESCPVYRLPNTFTPNGDGVNETFGPFDDIAFIERVEIRIFNQWGVLVFDTEDPLIEWDGSTNGGNEVSDGVYHYHIDVFALTSRGVEQFGESMSGFIHVISGD